MVLTNIVFTYALHDNGSGPTSFTYIPSSHPTSGNILALGLATYSGTKTFSVSDNHNGAWTRGPHITNGTDTQAEIWTVKNTFTGSITITVTETSIAHYTYYFYYEITNNTSVNLTSTGTGNSSIPQVSPSVAPNSGDTIVVCACDQGGGWGAGAGYTRSGSVSWLGCSEYADSWPSGNTSGPWNAPQLTWSEVLVTFTPPSSTTVTITDSATATDSISISGQDFIRIDTGFFTASSYEQNVFRANGLYWVFYHKYGTGALEVGYSTSPDSITWSPYTMAIATVGGGPLGEVDFNVIGNTIYYVSGASVYRYGTLNGDGTITWTIPETSIGIGVGYLSLALDSNGKIYIASASPSQVQIITNRTGVWTVDKTITTPFANPFAKVVALTNGKMFVVYGDFLGSNWFVERFDGANWNAGSNTVFNGYCIIYSELVSIGDTVYGSAVKASSGLIVGIDFVKYDYNTDTWSASVIATGQTSPSTILTNYFNTLLITYSDLPGSSTVYTFSTNLGSTWSGLVTTSISLSPFDLTAILTNSNDYSVVFDHLAPIPSIDITPDPPIIIPASITITDSATATDSIYLPYVTITDYATATDSISISLSSVTITDSATATDWISIVGNKTYITITDFAYAEDNISIDRGTLPVCGTASGAYPLSAMEKDYINLGYQQIIDTAGIPITYRTATIVGEDAYEHPIITYTDQTIVAFITILGNDEYQYIEEGFLPNHYANMWVYCVTPQVGDHVVWQSIEWEVRNSIPKVISGDTVYYQTILRRVLARVPLTGEVGDGTNLGDTTGSGGTLQSGGVQYPPEADP